MEDLPIYPDGVQELIPIPIIDTIRNSFKDLLLEDPKGDLLLRDEPYGTLVYVDDPSSRRRVAAPSVSGWTNIEAGVGSVFDSIVGLNARATMGEIVKTFYYLIRLKLEGFQSDVIVLFQGGFVDESAAIISTMSVGTIYDYSIPRGSAIIIREDGTAHMDLSNCGDASTTSLANPLATVLKTELTYKESNLSMLMARQLQIGGFSASRRGYAAAGTSIFSILPRQGRTVVSLLLAPLGMEPPSIGQSFSMRKLGQDKPIQLEVSIPSIEKMQTALEIIRRYQKLPDNLRTHETPTSSFSGYGVSTLLSLEIAQTIYGSERSMLSLYEVLEKGHYYRKTTDCLRAEFSDMNIDFKEQFPRLLIHKSKS
ncbi:MAG: hypothetical protein RTV41_10925 [Candidatus Thorarchaeota archaeon]